METLMTTEEVADYFRVDVVTVRRLINRGELAAYRIGSEYRFTQTDLENYLKQQRVSSGETGALGDNPAEAAQLKRMMNRPMTTDDMGRFDKFTERARQVLTLAHTEAAELHHNYIGTEHLLLGLIREGSGVAAAVLLKLGIELDKIRDAVIALIGRGDKEVTGMVGLTPRAKKVIELAVKEAQFLGHHYIGTEHLLLGLIREGEGIGARVLVVQGVQLDQVRIETMLILYEGRKAHEDPPPVPAEAAALLPEDQQGTMCERCGARNPAYFHYCFNCGEQLP